MKCLVVFSSTTLNRRMCCRFGGGIRMLFRRTEYLFSFKAFEFEVEAVLKIVCLATGAVWELYF